MNSQQLSACTVLVILLGAFLLPLASPAVAEDAATPARKIRVVVWDERQPRQKKVYPEFLGNHIAAHLRQNPRLEVQSVALDDPEQGLSQSTLDRCDVLVWWGHVRQGEISEATGKGRHTTTVAELMPLPYGGFVVDTPGLKEFGLWNLTGPELEVAFPELQDIDESCRFSNCSHIQEPECAVISAVEAGTINTVRYRSYVTLRNEIDDASSRG